MAALSAPHGGALTDQVLSAEDSSAFLKEEQNYIKIPVDFDTTLEVENITTGVLSPLKGFMTKSDFLSVIKRDRLADDTPWTIPILFHLPEKYVRYIAAGDAVLLEYQGDVIGRLHVEEIYTIDAGETAQAVFGTTERAHPGVNQLLSKSETVAGGKVELVKKTISVQSEFMLPPQETRKIFEQKGWRTIAGFQTRNVIHRAHEYLQRVALEYVDGLFLQPIIGWKKTGDFDPDIVIEAYTIMVRDFYPQERVFLSGLPTAMRYAGPKEAVFHAIIRKNYGCTHFIVGRDHAGVGGYYGKYDAHKIFDRFENLGIVPLRFCGPFYCSKCESTATEKTCGHSEKDRLEISGTLIREILNNHSKPSEHIFRPEIYKFLLEKAKTQNLYNQ
ncbi:sulfate adenylyltransferase [bacterium SM23_31]|nr:MAG: sulfate adenylyltransferase [bacterium SM23_31]